MKMTKRIFSLVLVMVMMVCMATSASALTLTIQGDTTGHTYHAYQIFSGKLAEGSVKLTDMAWGSGVNTTKLSDLLAELKADSVIGADFAALTDATFTAEELSEILKDYEDEGPKADAFAAVMGKTQNVSGDSLVFLNESAAVKSSTPDSDNKYSFTLDAGYYLIMDAPNSVVEEDDFHTKYLLAVTNHTNIAVKGDTPRVEKEVSATLTDGYSAQISNQLNKTHYYQWTGTVPSNIEDFDFFYYAFEDKMSEGLTFKKWEQVWIQKSTGEKHYLLNTADPTSVNPTVANALGNPDMAAAGFSSSPALNSATDVVGKGVGDSAPATVTMSWNDLKQAMSDAGMVLQGGDTIHVVYSAVLNENAVIGGDGNPNTVELTYSNNPHDEDDKGKTPPADPRVYSFQLEVLKYTMNGETKSVLPNAEFILYHEHGSTPHYAVITGGKITSWTTDKSAATKVKSGTDGKLVFAGLQQGVGYFLEETAAPSGYNQLKNPIKIQITNYVLDTDGVGIASIEYQVNSHKHITDGATAKAGMITTEVENKSGTELPTTGGVGTTMFYAAGIVLVAAGVVLLITKKRKAEEN